MVMGKGSEAGDDFRLAGLQRVLLSVVPLARF